MGLPRALPEDQGKINEVVSYQRSHNWIQVINCYRGVFRYACENKIGDKQKVKEAMADLIEAANTVRESKSVKQCYLRAIEDFKE